MDAPSVPRWSTARSSEKSSSEPKDSPFGHAPIGGGVKKGAVIGCTDEIGLRQIERPVQVHDLHSLFG
jgi:hypothetical protein